MKTSRSHAANVLNAPPAAVNLQPILEAVLRRAEQQGHILAREVREELVRGKADPRLWRDVLHKAGPFLERRGGHYLFVPTASPVRRRQEEAHHRIQEAVHELVQEYRKVAGQYDRREANRVTFLQPVVVETAAGAHHVLTKDISSSGLRLLGARDLLGQKLRVTIPRPAGPGWTFTVRIVWTCRVGDELYENGGTFLELESRDGQAP
jgi:hypothetical protein